MATQPPKPAEKKEKKKGILDQLIGPLGLLMILVVIAVGIAAVALLFQTWSELEP